MEQDNNVIFNKADEFKSYFKDDEKSIDSLITKLDSLQQIIDGQINEISQAAPGRGTQKYLIDHITNAMSVQTEKQALLRGKRDIKENALTLALKNEEKEGTSDTADVLNALSALIKNNKEREEAAVDQLDKKINKTEAEIDDEIEKRLADNG